jgi:hypothetical protein
MITTRHVHVQRAWRTPQFWMLFTVLCMNVSAGIGVIGMASPMLQEVFWASLSDFIGRKRTYFVFFTLGILLYSFAPTAGRIGSVPLFVAIFCFILTMYGGGFATIPAYIADLFGTRFVGAIHGRILLAWSTAGILGPQLVNNIREYRISHGVPPAEAYNTIMYILAGLLVIGFLANLAVRPVAERYYMTDAELAQP